MKKIFYFFTIILLLSSCYNESTPDSNSLCDCVESNFKYRTIEEAEKEMGKNKVDECIELLKNVDKETLKAECPR